MVKVFNPTFTINLANNNKPKIQREKSDKAISRKCLGRVILYNDEFRVLINNAPNEDLCIPLTDNSLELKGKTHVFAKNKDKYGHHICVIRDQMTANLSPGLPTQYDAVKENLLIAGHIIRKNGIMLFEYEDLVAFHYLSEAKLTQIKIDENKPLFNK